MLPLLFSYHEDECFFEEVKGGGGGAGGKNLVVSLKIVLDPSPPPPSQFSLVLPLYSDEFQIGVSLE